MYEKYGLMVKITNKEVINYLRNTRDCSQTSIIENALRKKLGVPLKEGRKRVVRDASENTNTNALPVKINEIGLIEHIMSQKKNYGISYRHTVESAVLEFIGK